MSVIIPIVVNSGKYRDSRGSRTSSYFFVPSTRCGGEQNVISSLKFFQWRLALKFTFHLKIFTGLSGLVIQFVYLSPISSKNLSEFRKTKCDGRTDE